MRTHRIVMATLACGVVATAQVVAQRPASHDKAFWQRIAASKFAPPAGEPIEPLVLELSGYLASPDPELRDDIAYTTLVSWIYRQKVVPVELRRVLLKEWMANLRAGIGTRGTDAIFRRSFSALALGIMPGLDNEAAFLEPAEFNALVSAALDYLRNEVDVRGFDATKGWMHSAAHTADLLKFLGRSRHLQPAQQAAILDGILDKMNRTDEVLTHGEDERLARAVLSITARSDFDEAGFKRWAGKFAPLRGKDAPTPANLATAQNKKNLATALFAVLSTDTRNLPSVQAARAIILETLKAIGM